MLLAFSCRVTTSGWSVKSGAKYSKYSVKGSSLLICSSTNKDVSYVQQRATFLKVYLNLNQWMYCIKWKQNENLKLIISNNYPPPPTAKSGTFKSLINLTHSPWPFVLREKHPNLSFANESAPHCKTIAVGW